MMTQAQEGGGNGHDPFWMVPGPVKWAAGNLGGILANINPWKGQPAEQITEPQIEPQTTEVCSSLQSSHKFVRPEFEPYIKHPQIPRKAQQNSSKSKLHCNGCCS